MKRHRGALGAIAVFALGSIAGCTTTVTAGGGTTTAEEVSWTSNATAYRGMNGARVRYDCPPAGTAGTVWGTEVYTDDSSVCTAGVHAGRITLAAGGSVVIEIRAGQDSYVGSDANGIESQDYGSWQGSFVIVP